MTDAKPIYVALAAVMDQVRSLKKGDRNNAQNFSFRGIDSTLNAIGPALRSHGVVPLPEVIEHHSDVVEVGKNRTPMRQVTLLVKYTFVGPAGDSLAVIVPGEAMDSGDKAMPKAMSVAMRTALLQTFALPTDELDPDQQVYERSARARNGNGGTPSVPDQRNGNGQPAAEKAPTPAELQKRAVDALDVVLVAATEEAAESVLKRVEKSPAKHVNVSGSLSESDREVLGVAKETPLTLLEVATTVSNYVAKHKRAVRAEQKAPA